MTEIRLYTLTEVMAIIQVTRRTVYNYIKSGDLKAVKIGKYWRVRQEDLEDFTKKGTKQG